MEMVTEAPRTPEDSSAPQLQRPNACFGVNTTKRSVFHWIGSPGSSEGFGPARIAVVWVIVMMATYLPLFVAAAIGPLSLRTIGAGLKLPFLHDLNIAFAFLVSLPALVVFTLTDQHVLTAALNRVQLDGVVSMTEDAAKEVSRRWERRFCHINIAAQVLGLVAGVGATAVYHMAYLPNDVGFWIRSQGRLLLVGYLYLLYSAVFYGVVAIYAVRCIAIAFLLRDIVENCRLSILPLHPDKCGGLRPVGGLGLRNQYLLSIMGINVVLLVTVSLLYLGPLPYLTGVIGTIVVTYLVLGPAVFLAPLLPFRGAMLRTKAALMTEVARRLRMELARLRQLLPSGELSRSDEELVDRLRKIGAVLDEFPVWPFDAGTFRKFITAYAVPLLSAVGYPIAKAVLSRIFDSAPMPGA